MQSRFRCTVKRDDDAARTNLHPAFQSFSIIEETLADYVEIDHEDGFGDMPVLEEIPPEVESDTDDDDHDKDHNDPEVEADDIQNIYADGIDFEWEEPRDKLPPHGPPTGYEYTPFVPEDAPREYVGHIRTSPTMQQALAALTDLRPLIQPKRQSGAGYKDPELDLWTRARLEGMRSMLLMYTNPMSRTYNNWGASSCQAAIGMGRGRHCARRLRELCRAFIADRKVLPVNPFGDWNESMLADENLRNEISIFLLSIGNEISAKKLMDFLAQPDIKEKFGIEKSISHKTACRYLKLLLSPYPL